MQGIEPQFLGYPARNQVTVMITLKCFTTSCSVKFISKPLFFVVCVWNTTLYSWEDGVAACSVKMRRNL
jgi:hypothetical protein